MKQSLFIFAVAALFLLGVVAYACLRLMGYRQLSAILYGGAIAMLLLAVMLVAQLVYLSFGVEYTGGTALVYEVLHEEGGEVTAEQVGEVHQILNRRMIAFPAHRIRLHKTGDSRLEVAIGATSKDELERLKAICEAVGRLRFLIVADTSHPQHQAAIKAAQAPENKSKRVIRLPKESLNDDNELVVDESQSVVVGRWANIPISDEGKFPLSLSWVLFHPFSMVRDAKTKEALNPNDFAAATPGLSNIGVEQIEVFMFADDGLNVQGSDLKMVKRALTQDGACEIAFSMTPSGATRMAALTGKYTADPVTGQEYQMGIVLDDELISAPTIQSKISDSGRITGNFTEAEVEFLVNILRAGSLPTDITFKLVEENQLAPTFTRTDLLVQVGAALLACVIGIALVIGGKIGGDRTNSPVGAK